eukprot:CAMPEP_0198706432 /NCGR_PEP_ID=MMETSP1468-20131203/390965_1 /TAXON_ID=1461545 /ORGANISM="Mantoniella sp, Strain CCMP1436" /LENGTH=58 /DNA_ID=CAMNT_0044465377 /DNA_START=742 /DNA_END=914 /DNA_ORIENTATION=+
MKQSAQLSNNGHKQPAASPEIGGALYYAETEGGGNCGGAGTWEERRDEDLLGVRQDRS